MVVLVAKLTHTPVMQVQIMSDLHLELHRDLGLSFIDSMDPTGVDLLVLAGDILNARFLETPTQMFARIAKKYAQVFYVPGNHEYWRTDPEKTNKVLQAAAKPLGNFKVLLNELVHFRGRRFLAGPMFFPRRDLMVELVGLQALEDDFKTIGNFSVFAATQFQRFNKLLTENLRKGDVVISHYLPSPLSTPQRFKYSAMNPFFVEDMTELIEERKPALWIHGHTHDSADYTIGETRVICNPFGYPKTPNKEFEDVKIISLDA